GAKKLFSEALAIFRRLPGDQRLGIATTLSALSGAALWSGNFANAEQLLRVGKYSEAEQMLNEALQIERGDFGAGNQRVASIEANLGTLYERENDPVRAMKITKDALRIISERLTPDHPEIGYFMDAVAKLYLDSGDLDNAEITARKVLAIYEKSLPPRHLYVAATRQLLGEVLLRRGQLIDAERELSAALEIDVSSAGSSDWRAARAEASLGWLR